MTEAPASMPDPAPRSRFPRWPQRLQAAGLHLLLALFVTWPMVLSPRSRLVDHGDIDVWNHAWGAWWYFTSISHGQLPYHTRLLAAPEGGVLWYIDAPGALIGAPLVPLLGTVGAYNAVILLYVLLASVASRRLARALGASATGSWIASVVLCCSPYLLSEIHNGVSEMAGVCWSIFALGAGWRAMEGGGRRAWVALGLWLGLAAVGTWYYGFASLLVLATWAFSWLVRGPRLPKLGGLALAAGCCALIVLPLGWAIQHSIMDPQAIVVRGQVSSADQLQLLAHNAVDARTFLWPLGFQSVDLAAQGEAFLHSSYLGWLALALAVSTRRWRVLAAALVVALVSLGPWLWWGDHWVTLGGGQHIPLPFRVLLPLLPSAGSTHAQRLGMPVIALVGAMAAVGAGRFRGRWQLLVILAVGADALLWGGAPWPLACAPALDPAACEYIRSQPVVERYGREVAAVIDLPAEVGASMATSRYLLLQTVHGKPIPYRPDARGSTAAALGLASFRALSLLSAHRAEHLAVLRQTLSDYPDVELEEMAKKGYRWVVVHRELERGRQHVAETEAQLERWFGPPVVIGSQALYSTVGPAGGRRPILPPPPDLQVRAEAAATDTRQGPSATGPRRLPEPEAGPPPSGEEPSP